MFTRCPACHTVHPVNAAMLAQGGGRYRCGKCNKSADALESLFDAWPEAGEQAPTTGTLPVFGMSIDLTRAKLSRLTPDEAALSGNEPADDSSPRPSTNRFLRAAWIVGTIAIIVVVMYRLADYQGKPMFDSSGIESTLIDLGLKEAPAGPPFQDLASIHLVSRELKNNPDRPGMLRLSATIVNRAARPQPFPKLAVTLLDAAGYRLNRHDFEPSEYLSQGSMKGAGMAPQAYLPLTLDLADPGAQAVGFELKFY